VTAPTGEQFEIAFGEQRAVAVEVGGGLRTYLDRGGDLVDGYGVDEMCGSGRGQVLVPWPNRIQDGAYQFEGRRHQLPLSEVASRNAIHGLVRWVPWRLREREATRVALVYLLHPQPGYPFSLALEIEYTLDDMGLTVRTTATNVGARPCPYGSGAHPYLTVGTPTVNQAVLHVPAATMLLSDERGIPVRAAAVEAGGCDFREPRAIDETVLDTAFTDLERDADGRARVTLRDPAGARGLTLWVDESYRYLMVFTGDPLPDVQRRSIAVEPMTCPPNAFRTGEALIRLAPGESCTGAWGITGDSDGGAAV
jgi:aldose 1-epimerase